MQVLVTGGAGFIGANLCRRLLLEPQIDSVRVIDDLSTGQAENLAGVAVDLIEASILDDRALKRATDGCDAIVHLAAVPSVPRSIADPMTSHEVNATGSLKVLESARLNGGAHVVLASSSSVYGANKTMPKSEELQCLPMSPYAVSKLAAEQYAMAYSACYDMPVMPFRFFNVFGPLQAAGHAYAAVVPAFIDAALNGSPLPVNGDGEQSRDFTFVGTVAEVLASAVLGRVTSSPTNLAFGTRTTLNQLAMLLERVMGSPLDVEHRPSRVGDVQHSQASETRFRRLFADIRPVDLQQGLTETVEWMRRHKSSFASS